MGGGRKRIDKERETTIRVREKRFQRKGDQDNDFKERERESSGLRTEMSNGLRPIRKIKRGAGVG